MPWPPDSLEPSPVSRLLLWIRLHAPSLRVRKVLYLVLAIPSAIVWFPISVLGLGFFVGAIGVVALPVLIRCVLKLPISGAGARRYYGALVFLGVSAMGILLVAYLASGGETVLLVVTTGVALLCVGCAVLVEIMAPRGNIP